MGSSLNLKADTWEQQAELWTRSLCHVPVAMRQLQPPRRCCVNLSASTHISKGAKSGLAIWYPCFTML